MRTCFIVVCLVLVTWGQVEAHSDVNDHIRDMREVFGFKKGNAELTEWMRFISSDMIDKTDFHYKLKNDFGFDCTSPKRHRLLFHWGYNSKPWNENLERRIRQFARDCNLQEESLVAKIREEVKREQIRRNRLINKKTEELFGFYKGGTEAMFANFFASIAYDIHLLGDYMTDNKVLDGLQNFGSIIGDMVNRIRALDSRECQTIIKGITVINMGPGGVQDKADRLMAYLKKEMPIFIKKARKGSIRCRLEGENIYFEE